MIKPGFKTQSNQAQNSCCYTSKWFTVHEDGRLQASGLQEQPGATIKKHVAQGCGNQHRSMFSERENEVIMLLLTVTTSNCCRLTSNLQISGTSVALMLLPASLMMHKDAAE